MPKVRELGAGKSEHLDLGEMGGMPGDKRDMGALRLEYIAWLSVPPGRRDPPSQNLLSQKLGVTNQTLYNWKKDPRISSQVQSAISSTIAVNDLPQIVEALKEQAFDPENPRSVQAAKVLIELLSRGSDETNVVEMSDMSNKQIRALAAQLHDEVDERIHDKESS